MTDCAPFCGAAPLSLCREQDGGCAPGRQAHPQRKGLGGAHDGSPSRFATAAGRSGGGQSEVGTATLRMSLPTDGGVLLVRSTSRYPLPFLVSK